MNSAFVDVEDAQGDKIGDGPLYNLTDWSLSRSLDKVGSYSYTVLGVPISFFRQSRLLYSYINFPIANYGYYRYGG